MAEDTHATLPSPSIDILTNNTLSNTEKNDQSEFSVKLLSTSNSISHITPLTVEQVGW